MASRPTVGSKVLAGGRPGEVMLDDPSDPDMTYKVCFADGKADWFKQADVCLDASDEGATVPADDEASRLKAQRAAEELAAMKEAQEKYSRDFEAQQAALRKDIEQDVAKRSSADYKESTFTDASRPDPPATTNSVTTSGTIAEDNEVY